MQKEIQKWIEKFVSKPNKLLNGFPPCPYARTALIKYVETDHVNMLFDIMLEWNDDVEVVVLHTPTENYTPEGLRFIVNKFNQIAMKEDIVALEDHPDDVENVNGVKMNFGKCIKQVMYSKKKVIMMFGVKRI
jgi:hypothetical protein